MGDVLQQLTLNPLCSPHMCRCTDAGQSREGQGTAGQGRARAGQGTTRQGRAGQGRSCRASLSHPSSRGRRSRAAGREAAAWLGSGRRRARGVVRVSQSAVGVLQCREQSGAEQSALVLGLHAGCRAAGGLHAGEWSQYDWPWAGTGPHNREIRYLFVALVSASQCISASCPALPCPALASPAPSPAAVPFHFPSSPSLGQMTSPPRPRLGDKVR